MKAFNKFSENINLFDLYGSPIQFYLNQKTSIKTKFGGLISLCVITVALFVIVLNIQNWASGANYQIVPSFESWTYNEMIAKDISFPYNFSNKRMSLILLWQLGLILATTMNNLNLTSPNI